MTWGQGSTIPQRIKDQVRVRDKTCQLRYPGICTGAIDEFDHPDGLAAQGQDRKPVRSAREVQGVCTPCHDHKTEQQRRAGIARAKAARGSLSKRYRDREPHPGAL
ncbi:hypothetical protein [Mycolicibacterium wolinskyi]|uniref:hypothetical protein n=1 Tax=Mycolicibacterium wolinskyi TaxID=59750 RepID=UPI0039176D71